MTDETMRAELLPCPFCGGRADMVSDERISEAHKPQRFVECQLCFAQSPSCADDGTFARNYWNRRAPTAERTRCAAIARAAGREDIAGEIEQCG